MKTKIISKIKKFIKKRKINMNKILNINNEYKIDLLNNNNYNLLGVYNNDNNKLLIAGPYNFYGIYYISNKIWVWGSSIPGIEKNVIKNIYKIKSFSYLFENDIDNISNFYYQLLTQDIIMIKNEKELELINELLLYLSNDLYYYNPLDSNLNIQFYTLKKIKEKYI
jgi:hypothetical protein